MGPAILQYVCLYVARITIPEFRSTKAHRRVPSGTRTVQLLTQPGPAFQMSVSKRARKASSDLDQASVSPSEEDSESPSESEKTSDQVSGK